MKKGKIIAITLLLLFVAGIIGGHFTSTAYATENKKCEGCRECKIVIVHTNDFHGNLKPLKDKKMAPDGEVGGSAYIAAIIEKLRKDSKGHILLLDAGDIAQGTPISNYYKGIPVIEVMNYLKYDAMTIGNHEFDFRQPALKEMIKKAKFPFVCANVIEEKSGKIPFGMKPYIIKNMGCVKVGILGLTTVDTPYVTKMENVKGLKFLDPVTTANKYIPMMKKDGADVIVVLSHMGVDDDKKFANKVKGIDLIVGGHSHTQLDEPIVEGETRIVQAKCHGKYVGKMEITYNLKDKKIVGFTQKAELIPVLHDGLTPDQNVLAIIDKYEKELAPKMSVVLGKAEKEITRMSEKGRGDWPLGNLICDSMLSKTKADIAIYNPGGIRADINSGDIKVEDVFKVLPFDNWLVTFKMKGEDLLKVLEHGAKGSSPVQVAGMTFTIDYAKPEGQRISEVMVGGKPLDKAGIYTVTTIDFLFTGGDGFDFKKATDVKYGDFARTVLEDYIKAHSPIKADPNIRIRVTGEAPKEK